MFLGSMNNTDSPTTHIGKVTEMEVTTELEQETDRSVYSLQVGKSPITTILVDFLVILGLNTKCEVVENNSARTNSKIWGPFQ